MREIPKKSRQARCSQGVIDWPGRSARLRAAACVCLSLFGLSCGAQHQPANHPPGAAPSIHEPSPRGAKAQAEPQGSNYGLIEPFRIVNSTEKIPHFSVTSESGEVYSSKELLQEGPIVLSFFASWCYACSVKAPILKRSLSSTSGKVHVLLVSLDDASSFSDVPEYLRENQLDYPLIRASAFPHFTRAFNPSHAVPLVAVINTDAKITTYQIGVRRFHEAALKESLRLTTLTSLAAQ